MRGSLWFQGSKVWAPVVEVVAIATRLGEGGCHVAVVSRRAGRSAVGIGMWPPSAVVLWVVEPWLPQHGG